jgi:hypothetical protein
MSGLVSAAVGCSTHTEPAHAGKEAAEQALAQLPGPEPKFAFVFGSSWLDQQTLLRSVASTLSEIPLIGASTAGEITPTGPASHACVVLLLQSSSLKWATGFAENLEKEPRQAGQRLAHMAAKQFQHTQRLAFFFLGDGLFNRYGETMRGIQEVLGTNSRVIGAMAGDDLRFSQTFQYHRGTLITGGIAGILLGGEGTVGIGLEHGFAPISKPRRVTRASANVLHELDRKPAAAVYEEYLGSEMVHRMRQEGLTRQNLAYPLGIQSEGADRLLLRNIVSFHNDGSLWCTGEILEGSWMQLMISSRSLAIEASRRAAQQALQGVNKPACALVFSSFARPKLQGQGTSAEELMAIRNVIGESIPMAGFYSYGEQGPLQVDALHNHVSMQTGSVMVTVIGS